MQKNFAAALAAIMVSGSALACEPLGWVLVKDKLISITERMCVYEKNGARLMIMVSGFCPFSPC